MADILPNIARGRNNELCRRVVNNDPATSQLVLVILQAAEADAVLQDYDDLAALLAAAGNTECNFTNYARQTYTDSDLAAPVVDDVNNDQAFSLPARTITSAGGAANNTGAKAVLCFDRDQSGDASLVPMCIFDASFTTNGQDLNIPAAEIFQA